MPTTLTWQPLHLKTPLHPPLIRRQPTAVQAFRRSDFDRFARRVTSGEALRDAWRSANDGFEQLVFEARKTAERIDRQYSVSRRLSSAARAAGDRAREIDREFEIGVRWRTFSMDFSRNWPRYRKQLTDFLNTPIGRSFATIFFLWFALSGWLFRILILATWVLPIAGPLLIGTIANNLVIKICGGFIILNQVVEEEVPYNLDVWCIQLIALPSGFTFNYRNIRLLRQLLFLIFGGDCPACKRQFAGYKNQIIRCASCGNIVWQPKGDFFSRGGRGSSRTKSNEDPDIIDVEFEEK